MGKTTIFFLPPSRYRTERQGGRPWKGEGAPATQAMGAAGKWGKTKRRSRATHSSPHLGRDGLWREIDGGGRSATRNGTGGAGGGDGELGEEGRLVVEVRDEVGSRSGPFIGAERRFGRRFLSSRIFDGRQWWWGENIMALTSGWRGFGGLDAVGCDASCRLAVEEGRQRRRAVVEVTGRSNGGLRLSEKRGRCCLADCGAGLGVPSWRAWSAGRRRGRCPGGGAQACRVARGEKGGRAGGLGLETEGRGTVEKKMEKEKGEKGKEK
jgi:hypothetical protein